MNLNHYSQKKEYRKPHKPQNNMNNIQFISSLSLLLPNFFLQNNTIRLVGQRATSRIRATITHSLKGLKEWH